MSKPHVEHHTCNIHIQANFELGKHVGKHILHNWLIQQWTFQDPYVGIA